MLFNCVEKLLEKILESSSDCKEIKPVHPKQNQSWIFIRRTDAEAETPILWPRDAKNWLIGKDPDAGEDWRQEEKGMTEDEMVGWHHWLNGHEFEYALGIGDGQGSLACCSPWGCRVRHDWATELNWRLTLVLVIWLATANWATVNIRSDSDYSLWLSLSEHGYCNVKKLCLNLKMKYQVKIKFQH